MNAGEIGESAGRVFKYKAPLNWIILSQEDQDDHGIDCEIELKDSIVTNAMIACQEMENGYGA